MNYLKGIAECLTGIRVHAMDLLPGKTSDYDLYLKTKPTDDEVAADFVDRLLNAEKDGQDLKKTTKDVVGTYGWTEKLAVKILECLQKAVENGAAMGKPAKDACIRATWEARDFVHDHPVFCTIVALGILAIITPWVIEALGFGELGPIEGTFASWWQARYAGYVPKSSLFSFFQRLGMVWH